MPTTLDRYKSELDALVADGKALQLKLVQGKQTFASQYQHWYTLAHPVIRQLVPHRLAEFEELYHGEKRRKNMSPVTYSIRDFSLGHRFGSFSGSAATEEREVAKTRFQNQLSILESAQSCLDSSLHDIKRLVQADMFDSELDAARELAKNGFVRAAGAVAGVVLEKHLLQVIANHAITLRKSKPTLSTLYDAVKDAGVIEVPEWRRLQRLGDLRNLCDHGGKEPTPDDVSELIAGVDKTTKTVF